MTNLSDALAVGLLIAFTVVVVGFMINQVVREFRFADPPVEVERFGYVLGEPDAVQCSVCGAAARCAAHFRRDRQVWTEWRCTRCAP